MFARQILRRSPALEQNPMMADQGSFEKVLLYSLEVVSYVYHSNLQPVEETWAVTGLPRPWPKDFEEKCVWSASQVRQWWLGFESM